MKLQEGNTEVLTREFDAIVTEGTTEYHVYGVFEHGSGFHVMELTMEDDGDYIDAGIPEGSQLWDQIQSQVEDWLTSI